ncbi:MAG: hypothetical protein CM15mP47_2630 [Methanobacteriota archaeon]|nr:MAG: hypothetical protein CM15mP47_2630 [Euryarchaeota archaeon]
MLIGGFGTAGRMSSLGNLILHKDIYDEFMDKFMAKVESTRIGNSSVYKDVLYGPMLSEKYGKDFLSGVEMANQRSQTNLGPRRDSNENAPLNFVGDASEGVFMWPHVFVDVTEDMEFFP